MIPILIVDDARDDLLLAETVLRHGNIANPVRFMTDGRECIQYFRGEWKSRDGELAQPCLVFLDLAMHPINGLEVLREIQNQPLFRESVVVMLSGIDDLKLVQQGYQLGAVTFLIKPLSKQDITNLLTVTTPRISAQETAEGLSLHWKTNLSAPPAPRPAASMR